MSDIPIDERRFTEQEVREILKKTVERAPSRALVKSEGLSLAELKAIAEEAGLDPARLEDAVRSVALKGSNPPNRILGAPTVLNFERRVEGELAEEDTPEVLSLIRRTMGQQGEVDVIRGSLEWSARTETAERYVTLSARDGTTTISGSSNLGNLAVLTYVPASFFGLIGTAVGFVEFVQNGNPIGLVLALVILPTLYLILRTIMGKAVSSESARLERVVDDLARLTGPPGS